MIVFILCFLLTLLFAITIIVTLAYTCRTTTPPTAGYVVVAMYSPAYEPKAVRLEASAKKYNVPLDIVAVPEVHSSISQKGSPSGITKAAFILQSLAKHHPKTVMYVDVDMIFNGTPSLDWSKSWLYNWNHPANDCVMVSGGVQVYANQPETKALLKRWHDLVSRYPNIEDDKMLDYTYNTSDIKSFHQLPVDYFFMPKHPLQNHKKLKQAVILHPDNITSQSNRSYSTSEKKFISTDLSACRR